MRPANQLARLTEPARTPRPRHRNLLRNTHPAAINNSPDIINGPAIDGSAIINGPITGPAIINNPSAVSDTAANSITAAAVNDHDTGRHALVGQAPTSTRIRHIPSRHRPAAGSCSGIGCGPMPVPRIRERATVDCLTAAGLGCGLRDVPPIREPAADTLVHGRGRRLASAVRLRRRARHGPDQRRQHQPRAAQDPKPAILHRRSSHHDSSEPTAGSIHSQAAAVAATAAPHSSLSPALT